MDDIACASCLLIYRGPSSVNGRFNIFRVPALKPAPSKPSNTKPSRSKYEVVGCRQHEGFVFVAAVGIRFMSNTPLDQGKFGGSILSWSVMDLWDPGRSIKQLKKKQ